MRGTKRDAERYYREKATERDRGVYVRPVRIAFGAYLDDYLGTVAPERVRPRTLRSYRWLVNAYVKSELGAVQLEALRPEYFDRLYRSMREEGGGRRGRGVGARTVRITHAVVTMALRHAVRRGQLARNPAQDATLPAYRPREKAVLTAEEATRFARGRSGPRRRVRPLPAGAPGHGPAAI